MSPLEGEEMSKAAIYHFTNRSEKRPIVFKKQLAILEEFASSKGFTDVDIYFDYSLRKCEHPQFDRLRDSCINYDALFTKDFYHLSKNTMQCLKIMKEFLEKNVPIYTLENGIFHFEREPFGEPLRVATYTCSFGDPIDFKKIVLVQNDTLKLFATKKTAWEVVDQFSDRSKTQNDGEQKNLKKLIENKENFDLLLVLNLNDIHWRTAKFCKIREQLQLDIYSLQDGFLKYRKDGDPQ